jgi:hypothetical protein
MDDCAICLERVSEAHGVSCDRLHTLHWECYRKLLKSSAGKRPRCPTCRCFFACVLCEGGSQIICMTCMRDNAFLSETRPVPTVYEIMHQHGMCWGLFVGAWSIFKIEQRRHFWSGDESELLLNVLFFINFHFNIWTCCDRVLEAVIAKAAMTLPLGESTTSQSFHARLKRIHTLHGITKRYIGGFAIVRIALFIYDAAVIFGNTDYVV